jgi:hypothetical protein
VRCRAEETSCFVSISPDVSSALHPWNRRTFLCLQYFLK